MTQYRIPVEADHGKQGDTFIASAKSPEEAVSIAEQILAGYPIPWHVSGPAEEVVEEDEVADE